MRDRLNNDPRVQLGLLAAIGLILFLTLFSGGGDPEPDNSTLSTAPPAEAGATDPAVEGASGGAAVPDPAAPAAPSTAPTSPVPAGGGSVDVSDLTPGEGLPEDVLVAFARNKAIALLVVDDRGISDAEVQSYLKRIGDRPDVEVFVVPAKRIDDYSRITLGAAVTRVPSLVVIRPREQTGGVWAASVREGFTGPRSIEIALEDALYDGEAVPYYPERDRRGR